MAVGKPIDISHFYDREGTRETLDELTKLIMREIAALSGRHDYQPQLAGRFYKTEVVEAQPQALPMEQCLARG